MRTALRRWRIRRDAPRVALALLAGCAPAPAPFDAPPGSPDGTPSLPDTYVYRCEGDYRFSVRVDSASVSLRIGDRPLTLPQLVAASGTRYGADGVVFWSKGLDATLETPTAAYRSCAGRAAGTPWVEARLLGYDFRAVGQEPGWVLEIEDGRRIHLATDYGQAHLRAPAPRPEVDPASGTTTYEAEIGGHDLRVVITGGRCEDTMSGEAFPASVVVTLDRRELRGCGRRLDGA